MYAMREVAKVRDNGKKMTQIAVEILLLHAFLSLLGYVVVAIVCYGAQNEAYKTIY